MKNILTLVLGLYALSSIAQPVARTIVAEHFTNTYCSICKNNNPGFYTNMSSFPGVLHIAYHPSSPYAACALNQHNKPENDARTNFYGVYGSTPRVVVQGAPVTGTISNPLIFTSVQGATSAFEMKTIIYEVAPNLIEVKVVVKKKDVSSMVNADLYAAVVEDTLFFAAPNGENRHYDVFRKSAFGSTPVSITLPANVGDSVVRTQQVSINSVWNKSRVYVIGILQDGSKNVEQAAKSSHLPGSTSATLTKTINGVQIFPNPTHCMLTVEGVADLGNAIITDMTGKEVKALVEGNKVDVSALFNGTYFISVQVGDEWVHSQFIRN